MDLTKNVYAVPGVNEFKTTGFVVTKVPGVPGAGTGEPKGKTIISHSVAVPTSVQVNCADVVPTIDVDKAIGFGHVIAGVQYISAFHPALIPVAFDVNTNVKHPLGEVAVNEGGKVVPVKVPRIGEVGKFPSLITKLSPAATLN